MSYSQRYVVRHAAIMGMALRSKGIAANTVRIPDPAPGEASVIQRYGKERAVLMHPSDFSRLAAVDELLVEVSRLEPMAPSSEALRAHVQEGTPQEPVTDPALLSRLFG